MLRVLIVSDRAEYRQLLAHHVTLEWGDAMAAEYEPAIRGRMPAGFTGSSYDVVLLDHEIQQARGLEWLEDFTERPSFPPVIYFGPATDEALRGRALAAGAAYYLAHADFEVAQFASALRDVVRRRHTLLSDASRAAREPRAPNKFGSVRIRGYRCVRRLAVGGSSSVFLAERESNGEPVVLKVFRQVPDVVDGNTTFDRFLREYQLVADLRHSNVVRIFDIGVADDHVYLSMEFFPGGDLRARMKSPLDWREALGYLRQMCDALGALHAIGVLHRDVKPGNVLLRGDGSVAFIDFGLARQVGLESEITGAGAIFGTPHYMSPEQGHGLPLDERSDLYSLGVIFHEMLTGEKPFVADTPLAVLYTPANEPVPALPERLGHLRTLHDSLLAKQVEARPASAAEVIAQIEALLASEAA